ncbi:MAG TPA: hypothetical protein DCQ31_05525 [Bacteroidales bacterium]|nr:hypothetical protein [Bacteroidales bacterium]
MYKIYFNDRLFVITTDNQQKIADFNFVYKACKNEEIEIAYRYFNNNVHITNFLFISKKPEKVFDKFILNFKFKEAAGGLVFNNNNELLFIKRNEKWDLPKGHFEKNEKPEVCALREVEEECGIKPIIISYKSETYHVYEEQSVPILKKTFWFNMKYTDTETPVPQLEENITEIKWFAEAEIDTVFNNTHRNLKQLMDFK